MRLFLSSINADIDTELASKGSIEWFTPYLMDKRAMAMKLPGPDVQHAGLGERTGGV